MAAGRPADTPVAVVHWGTTGRPAGGPLDPGRTGRRRVAGAPSIIVVGPVAALDLGSTARAGPGRSRSVTIRPLAGRRVVVTRARAQASSLVRSAWSTSGRRSSSSRSSPSRTRPTAVPGLAAAADRLVAGGLPVGGGHLLQRGDPAPGRRSGDRARARRRSGGRRWVRATARTLTDAGRAPRPGAEVSVSEALVEAFPRPGTAVRARTMAPTAGDGAVPASRDGAGRAGRGSAGPRAGWSTRSIAYRTVAGQPRRPEDAVAGGPTPSPSPRRPRWSGPSTLLGADGMPPVVVSIGPVTSGSVRAAGLGVAAEATAHTIDGLVDALVAALDRGRAAGATALSTAPTQPQQEHASSRSSAGAVGDAPACRRLGARVDRPSPTSAGPRTACPGSRSRRLRRLRRTPALRRLVAETRLSRGRPGGPAVRGRRPRRAASGGLAARCGASTRVDSRGRRGQAAGRARRARRHPLRVAPARGQGRHRVRRPPARTGSPSGPWPRCATRSATRWWSWPTAASTSSPTTATAGCVDPATGDGRQRRHRRPSTPSSPCPRPSPGPTSSPPAG